MRTLFVDNLTVIDCSLLDSEFGLSGASWIVDLSLSGNLDDESMLLDFGVVKKQVKALIDAEVDHKLIVPMTSAHCEIKTVDNNSEVSFSSNANQEFSVSAPNSTFCILPGDRINTEVVTAYLNERLRALLPENITVIDVSLRNEVRDSAVWFRYSHGLKKHNGNCQRITHGHRSRLEIYVDGIRDHALEREWVKRLDNIYIATREDLRRSSGGINEFSYRADQGTFKLSLPKDRTYLVDCDTTIEEIAQTLANAVASDMSDKNIKVIAWEGVDKGAIGVAN
jgi:6-pyruvoyl-tetrahydropterin synthase